MRNSQIILCSGIHLDEEHTNVLNYTENEMLTLCQTNALYNKNDYSFIRDRGTIQTDCAYGIALQCNYMAFQNKDYSNKWFFAFIDDVKYLGENNTEIVYTVDSFATFFPDLTLNNCYVIREHVNDDTIGLHTLDENLNVGRVQALDTKEDSSYSIASGYYIGVLSSYEIKDNSNGEESLPSQRGQQYSSITCYTNTIFGELLFLFKIATQNSLIDLGMFILRTNHDGHAGDISNIFILPNALVDETLTTSHTAYNGSNDTDGFTWDTLPTSLAIKTFDTTIPKVTAYANYTVRNQKIFTYPYNYLLVSNNAGNQNIYKYEDFNSTNCVFENQLAISIGCSGRLVPKNYKGMATDDEESIALAKYPTCGWSSDAFTNWLTQNAVNIATSIGMEGANIGMGVMSGSSLKKAIPEMESTKEIASAKRGVYNQQVSAGLSASTTVLNTIGQFYQASLLPNIRGGQATGDVLFSSGNTKFVFRQMSASLEYVKIIDSYFDRFGYKINETKTPNITGRTYWNYVEIGGNEEIGHGNIPNRFLDEINQIFRKGVTIWHNHANIGNYSLSNTIVSTP